MNRTVGPELDVTAHVGSVIELQVAVARVLGLVVEDQVEVTHDGRALDVTELATDHDGRLHTVTPPGPLLHHLPGAGQRTCGASGRRPREPGGAPSSQPLRAVGRHGAVRGSRVRGIEPEDLLDAVSSWVGTRLRYRPGASGPLDGAVDTVRAGAGVCRDYAHLVLAMLRGIGMPARLVAVYAPGCDPMDFTPSSKPTWPAAGTSSTRQRSRRARPSYGSRPGRDAADTASLATVSGDVRLDRSAVTAVVEGTLPDDDIGQLVVLG